MDLRYDDDTKTRLRHWRDSDRSLYEVVDTQLQAILASPGSHGISGSPHVPRLVTFGVNGRDAEYVITWEVRESTVYIGFVCPVSELQQRTRLKQPPAS